MTPAQRLAAWITTVAVVATGGAYAYFRWFVEPGDAFAVVNHPWQPTVLHLHVLVAPVWLFVMGMLWQCHVVPKLRARARPRRRSGLVVLALVPPMAASGYLLQTSVDEAWRGAWTWVHVGSSVAWTIAFAVHVAVRVRAVGVPAQPHRHAGKRPAARSLATTGV